jgi:putative transposase
LCRLFGYSKQAFYKRESDCIASQDSSQEIKQLVLQVRSLLPRTGGRKIYHRIKDEIVSKGIKMGRDKLFEFMREEHLLVPKRKKYHKTTNSKHWMRKYPNLIKDIQINRPEQIWVADITYLQVKDKHHYLHLITDAYSKKIVGYQLADNMLSETTVKALKMALHKRMYDSKLIHHSDRGLQYCSKEYTELLKENHIDISMTENSDPYENAIAERVNGILKDEFNLDIRFDTFDLMEINVSQSITLYNELRPHLSMKMLTPNMAHKQNKIELKTWKKQNPNRINEMGSVYL